MILEESAAAVVPIVVALVIFGEVRYCRNSDSDGRRESAIVVSVMKLLVLGQSGAVVVALVVDVVGTMTVVVMVAVVVVVVVACSFFHLLLRSYSPSTLQYALVVTMVTFDSSASLECLTSHIPHQKTRT